MKAITAVTDFTIPKSSLPTLRSRFVRFIKHYEAHYYKHKQHRLAACKAVFHALLHVADCVEWLGKLFEQVRTVQIA